MFWLTKKSSQIIQYCFLLLVFFTPLVFYSGTYELFEFNKMMFVYLLTIIIATFWGLRMISEGKWLWQRTPLDFPLLLFLIVNIISTLVSIDIHTSIFGYYSRLNGGLLSTIAYLTLYWAFMANFPRERIKYLLGVMIAGAMIVTLWAIPEHFGIDPSCKILVNKWAADCWVQDVAARVFATLGQPNWLGAYLGMVIPVSLGLSLDAKNKKAKIIYLVCAALMTLAFNFTYSRGSLAGLLAGLTLFAGLLFVGKKSIVLPKLGVNWRFILLFLAVLIVMELIWGTAISKPLSAYLPHPSQPTTNNQQPTTSSPPPTPTDTLRFIVWKGAVGIWKHYPLFGSGVETFADSYYQFRPAEANMTTEWDFLYNKAHNEYFNYLATTGTVGFLSYIFIIVTFLAVTFSKFWKNHVYYRFVIIGMLGAYAGYLVQNFFSFSVVTVALFFFLFPAITFKLLNLETGWFPLKIRLPRFKSPINATTNIWLVAVLVSGGLLLYLLSRLYLADLKFTEGYRAEGSGDTTTIYYLQQAVNMNPLEPFYQSELGYAFSALASATTDKTDQTKYLQEAVYWGEHSVQYSQSNLSFYRTLLTTYMNLIEIDPGLEKRTVAIAEKSAKLAPTEPKVNYNLGALYAQLGMADKATTVFQKVVTLKPDYREAYLALALSLDADGQRPEAIKIYKKIRNLFPQELWAPIKLKEWTGSEN